MSLQAELQESMRRRGIKPLPTPYAKGPPLYVRPSPVVVKEIQKQHCRFCNEDFPVEDFSIAAPAFKGTSPPCNACYVEKYGPTRYVDCAACGKPVSTRKVGRDAYHRHCHPNRAEVRNARPATPKPLNPSVRTIRVCADCQHEFEGFGERCAGCRVIRKARQNREYAERHKAKQARSAA